MKIAIVGLLVGTIGTVSCAFAADWTSYDKDEAQESYIDTDSIKKNGSIRTAWLLTNFNTTHTTRDNRSYRSVKHLNEYDCKNQRSRSTYIAMYSGEMGGISSVGSGKPSGEWDPVIPETVAEFLLQTLCKL